MPYASLPFSSTPAAIRAMRSSLSSIPFPFSNRCPCNCGIFLFFKYPAGVRSRKIFEILVHIGWRRGGESRDDERLKRWKMSVSPSLVFYLLVSGLSRILAILLQTCFAHLYSSYSVSLRHTANGRPHTFFVVLSS